MHLSEENRGLKATAETMAFKKGHIFFHHYRRKWNNLPVNKYKQPHSIGIKGSITN